MCLPHLQPTYFKGQYTRLFDTWLQAGCTLDEMNLQIDEAVKRKLLCDIVMVRFLCCDKLYFVSSMFIDETIFVLFYKYQHNIYYDLIIQVY